MEEGFRLKKNADDKNHRPVLTSETTRRKKLTGFSNNAFFRVCSGGNIIRVQVDNEFG